MTIVLKAERLTVPTQRLIVTHGLSRLSVESREVLRQAEKGTLRRLRRGVYIETETWRGLGDRERHIALMQAEQRIRPDKIVFARDSASAALGYPAYGYYGGMPHAITDSERRSSRTLVWHHGALADEEIIEVAGLQITAPIRTLVDLARSSSFARGVGYLDAGIRTPRRPSTGSPSPVTRLQLQDKLDQFAGQRGYRRACALIGFAREQADSLGESVSRVVEYLNGFPEPVLQYEVRDDEGLIGFADQAWPEYRLLGEFDGYAKYTRDQYTLGRSIEEIVFAEKRREDRMRATGRGMCRWLWADAHGQAGLVATLRRAGLPQGPPRVLPW